MQSAPAVSPSEPPCEAGWSLHEERGRKRRHSFQTIAKYMYILYYHHQQDTSQLTSLKKSLNEVVAVFVVEEQIFCIETVCACICKVYYHHPAHYIRVAPPTGFTHLMSLRISVCSDSGQSSLFSSSQTRHLHMENRPKCVCVCVCVCECV